MERSPEEQRERYIRQSVLIELGKRNQLTEEERLQRVRFWQGLTNEDRFQATWEIVKRVHLAERGSLSELKLNRSVVRVVRRKA